jgi:tetratricopeptide (TPR) repeat protein
MRVTKKISATVVMIYLLMAGLCHAQTTAEQHWTTGLEYAVGGKFEMAKEQFEMALKLDQFYRRAEAALKIIEDVSSHKVKSKAAIHLFKGEALRKEKKWDEAIAEYNKAIQLNSGYAEAYMRRGNAHSDKGEYDQAISDYTKAIDIDRDFAAAYCNRAYTYEKKGQYDQVISDYTKAIEINPRYAIAYNNRGSAYAVKGQYDQAISDYTKAIEINPVYSEAFHNRGFAHYFKQQYDKAWDDIRNARSLGLQIHPDFFKALQEASGRQE